MDIVYQQPEDSAGEDLDDDLSGDDDLGDEDEDDSEEDEDEEDEDEEGDNEEGEAIRRRREYGAAGARQQTERKLLEALRLLRRLRWSFDMLLLAWTGAAQYTRNCRIRRARQASPPRRRHAGDARNPAPSPCPRQTRGRQSP